MSVRCSSSGYTGDLPPPRFNLSRHCLEHSARDFPDKPALIVATDASDAGHDDVWTYGRLEDAVLRIARGLGELGVEPGGRLLIRMGNSADYALVFLGAIAAGLVPIPASSDLSASEIAFILEDSGAGVVVHSHDLDLPSAANALVTLDAGDIARLKQGSRGRYADTGADDPAYMVYTSGTSGRPKGVLHGHRAIWGRRPMYSGWYGGIDADDVTLHTGAFNWSYTMGTGLFDPWANGATAVLYTGAKDIQAWPALIARIKPSIMASVPALYRQMFKYCAIGADTFSSLRLCLVAGEALPPGVAEAWQAATGLGLREALGMSEISTYLSTSPAMAAKPGSPGRPQPGRSVAILPVEGGTTPCPAGETGVIAVHRSDPGMMLGYWNRPDEEAEVFRGDWFCGGDLGAMDDDGYIHFRGRNNDLMNAMGYRVSPVEVETVLARHPAVAEVAVAEIQVRNDVSIVGAFVVVQPGDRLEPADLLSFAAGQLADYKLPREVFAVTALPRTANGKLARGKLPDLARERNARSPHTS